MQHTNTLTLAREVFRKHKAVHGSFDKYPGTVSMHGMARLASESGDPALIEEIRTEIMPYVRGERTFNANFKNYFCGGNGAAWLLYKGLLPEAKDTVHFYAEEIMNEAPRDKNGILSHAQHKEFIWIDVAFAVTPFMLFAGLALENDDYIEEAFQQTAKMVNAFRVEETGLYNQTLNKNRPGHRSQDHWSRGNGWGALALCELASYLPDGHPRKAEAVAMYTDHVEACARYQEEDGLWRQEMTEKMSYVETSGSGLMLYALGSGIQSGVIAESEKARFENGLKGLLKYVSPDADVYHCCMSCCCPGEGTVLEYMARQPILNDSHAFGPVVLAMGQGHILGIENL